MCTCQGSCNCKTPKLNPVISVTKDELSGIVTVIKSDNSWYQYSTTNLNLSLLKQAGETTSSGMALIQGEDDRVYKYDITNINHYGKFIGISKTSALEDDAVEIIPPENIITEAGSGWVTGKTYFIGNNALPTETIPTVNISKRIGIGVAPDSIYIHNYEERILT